MKSVWNGSISFGLVNIPVRLYPVAEPKALGFRILCGKCQTPLHYKRWCKKCKKEIGWEDVIKGLEIKKGKYFVLTKEKIEKLKPEKTDFIDIVEFIDAHQLDPLYYDKDYYIVPAKSGEKAYFLFQEVLQASAKTAIGRFVMREKEYVCAIEAYKGGLLLTTLHYAYEIRDISKIEELKKAPRLTATELKLAKELISKLHTKEFDITKFKDTFAEKLKEAILKKGKIAIVQKVKPAKKETLVQALKASVR